jgi:hypothetical protein
MIYRLSLAWPQLQKEQRQNAFPKLFTFRERSRNSGFSCYNVTLLPENCYSNSLFTTGYKRLPEGGGNFREEKVLLTGKFCLAGCRLLNEAASDCCVSPPEQLSALRTSHIGFRKAMLKKS